MFLGVWQQVCIWVFLLPGSGNQPGIRANRDAVERRNRRPHTAGGSLKRHPVSSDLKYPMELQRRQVSTVNLPAHRTRQSEGFLGFSRGTLHEYLHLPRYVEGSLAACRESLFRPAQCRHRGRCPIVRGAGAEQEVRDAAHHRVALQVHAAREMATWFDSDQYWAVRFRKDKKSLRIGSPYSQAAKADVANYF